MTHRPLALFTLCFIAGIIVWNAWFPEGMSVPAPSAESVSVSGVIDSSPRAEPRYCTFILKTNSHGKISVFAKGRRGKIAFHYGDRIRFTAPIQSWPPARNPLLTSYGESMVRKKIFYQAVAPAHDMVIERREQGNPIIRLSYQLRDRLLAVNQKTLPADMAALLNSVLFGDSGIALNPELQTDYRRAGVIHLLVVSGSQVTILLGAVYSMLAVFPMSPFFRWLILSFINLFFVFMTGAGASISRAGFMAEILITGKLLRRKSDAITTMAVSALCLLLLNPLSLFDIGFQLSFVATWSLLEVAPVIAEALKNRLPDWLAGALSVVLATFLMITPLTLYYFSGVSLISLLSNLIVLPVVEFLVPFGFLSTLLGLFYLPATALLNGINHGLLLLLNFAVHSFSQVDFAYFTFRAPHVLAILLFYAAFLAWIERMKRRSAQTPPTIPSAVPVVLLALACVLLLWPQFRQDKFLTITLLDVGQADAILIETPQKQSILIDTGTPQSGTRVVVPVLQRKGIHWLDTLVATHAHSDHIGGMALTLQQIRVRRLLDTEPSVDPERTQNEGDALCFSQYRNLMADQKVPHVSAQAGSTMVLSPSISIHVLHPSAPFLRDTESDDNENSVVMKLTYGRFSMLLTGDMGQAGEARLLERMGADALRSTILKVGHHGSRSASGPAFLDAVRPQAALISCGVNNSFGHPHGATLRRLEERGIPIYRTDQLGAIIVRTDGTRTWIRGMIKRIPDSTPPTHTAAPAKAVLSPRGAP